MMSLHTMLLPPPLLALSFLFLLDFPTFAYSTFIPKKMFLSLSNVLVLVHCYTLLCPLLYWTWPTCSALAGDDTYVYKGRPIDTFFRAKKVMKEDGESRRSGKESQVEVTLCPPNHKWPEVARIKTSEQNLFLLTWQAHYWRDHGQAMLMLMRMLDQREKLQDTFYASLWMRQSVSRKGACGCGCLLCVCVCACDPLTHAIFLFLLSHHT